MKELLIDLNYFEKIKQHGESVYPNECCGFFFGSDDKVRTVLEIHSVMNSKEGDQKRRYEISPIDYFKAEKYALKNSIILLGVYHSHPDHPAVPSEYDRLHAAPYFSYIITSIRNGKYNESTSWRLNDQQQFEEEKLKITVN